MKDAIKNIKMNVRPVRQAGAAADAGAFALVYEMGPSNFIIERFDAEVSARQQAKSYWCCWCLFSVQLQPSGGAALQELATGGVGLGMTRAGIRRHALEALNPLAAGCRFANRPDRPVVAGSGYAQGASITFGIVYPTGLGITSAYISFDKTKPVERVVAGACAHGGIVLEKGRLAGEKLNLFTLDGDLVRLDLEVEAHLGSTLHPGDIMLLEKGNRVHPDRLQTVKAILQSS